MFFYTPLSCKYTPFPENTHLSLCKKTRLKVCEFGDRRCVENTHLIFRVYIYNRFYTNFNTAVPTKNRLYPRTSVVASLEPGCSMHFAVWGILRVFGRLIQSNRTWSRDCMFWLPLFKSKGSQHSQYVSVFV